MNNVSKYNNNVIRRDSYNIGNTKKERAKSVPKFRFQKRPHRKNNNNDGYSKAKPIRIENRQRSKILKNSRKPLGIPTPNTHINNFFQDYKSRENKENDFNTRDFFTPPSVQNRYMEGIFNNKHKQQQQQQRTYNNKNWNKNLPSNNGHIGTTTIDYGNNYKSYRRPSTTGSSYYSNKASVPRFSISQHNATGGFMRRGSATVQHSPGSYIPPNARNSHYSNSVNNMNGQFLSASPNIPDISTVLNEPKHGSYHGTSSNSMIRQPQPERYSSHGNNNPTTALANSLLDAGDTDEHDSDDILFTLDETDGDFVQNMNNLTINNKETAINHNNTRPMHQGNHPAVPTLSNSGGELPDLLKSPMTQSNANLYGGSPHMGGNGGGGNTMNPLLQPIKSSNRRDSESKYKPGVYVPPHHRKSFHNGTTNEAILSVSHNSVDYDNGSGGESSVGSRKYSAGPVTNRLELLGSSFNKPLMPFDQPSVTTTAVEDHDVFADSNNDALFFEDDDDEENDDDEEDDGDYPNERSMFGPYDIYTDHKNKDGGNGDDEHQRHGHHHRKNWKSSTFGGDVVGSLEQYKNNWLMLQQQQD